MNNNHKKHENETNQKLKLIRQILVKKLENNNEWCYGKFGKC